MLFAALIVSTALLFSADKPIYQSKHFVLLPDRLVEGEYSARALSRTEIESNYPVTGKTGETSRWTPQTDISRRPRFHSEFPLIDAAYNLSLDELQKDIRDDGAFMAGAKWEGVWTRDISYSILLSLAAIEPQVSKESLLRKVKRNRIIQDTGTGGSWPVSTDRLTWALAAWEIYQVTGDREWLRRSFEIIRNSVMDDIQVVSSQETGLAKGESSFLDWREQTYPRWMDPVDIYTSQALGTNAVHYRTYRILAAMARKLGERSESWDGMADRIRLEMNKRLWIPSRGYSGQYLYGRVWMSLSPRAEALGEALSILFDVPDTPAKQDAILQSVPVLEYGIPSIYPETPNIPPYHNRAVWPFVQAFWNLAAAKQSDGPALLHGLANIYRQATLFTTNKENFVADTGASEGTEVNSDRQLWSIAGNLAMVYRVLMGMEFTESGIRLHPVIPEELKGPKSLTAFRYRDAVLAIRIDGYGSRIRSISMDGHSSKNFVPGTLKGEHEIVIRMADESLKPMRLNLVENAFAPDTPVVRRDGDQLVWEAVQGAAEYLIYRNGKPATKTNGVSWVVPKNDEIYVEYQLSAVDSAGLESFLSEPVAIAAYQVIVEAETAAQPSEEKLNGYSGTGFVETGRTVNTTIALEGAVSASGRYDVSFRYSNGSGPVNTDNKCAVRTLAVDGETVGAIVLPQRGQDKWSDWGRSSSQIVGLAAGKHRFELRFDPYDENMNGEVNRAMIDLMRLVRIE
jgi:hypothetical protein